MSIKDIESRFPFLAEGEVIFLCSDGVFFNQGTEENRRKLARAYCFKHLLDAPERIEKKAKPARVSNKSKK